MNFAVIFIFKVDSEGHMKVEDDLIVQQVLTDNIEMKELIESDILDEVFEELPIGTNVKIEVYNVEYVGVKHIPEDTLIETIKEDMVNMLENKELKYKTDFEFYATVRTNQETLLQEG